MDKRILIETLRNLINRWEIILEELPDPADKKHIETQIENTEDKLKKLKQTDPELFIWKVKID